MIDKIQIWGKIFGFIFGTLAVIQYCVVLLFSFINSDSNSTTIGILSLILVVTLLIVNIWPLFYGIILLCTGLLIGTVNAILCVPVGIFYGFLPVISGLAFIVAGAYARIEIRKIQAARTGAVHVSRTHRDDQPNTIKH